MTRLTSSDLSIDCMHLIVWHRVWLARHWNSYPPWYIATKWVVCHYGKLKENNNTFNANWLANTTTRV